MAYYRPRKNPPIDDPSEVPQLPNAVDLGRNIWDTMKAPLAGLWQGLKPRILGGKNLNFEEYVRQKSRRRRGLSNQRRVASNWLIRTISGE